MEKALKVLTLALLTALVLLAAPAHLPKSQATTAPAHPMACGQSVNGHNTVGGLPTTACPEDGKPLFDKTCHVYTDDVKTCPIDSLPLYNGHSQVGDLAVVVRTAGFMRVGSTMTCGHLVNGHTTAGGQPIQQCSDDGKPIFPSDAHVFVDDFKACPYDGTPLIAGHVISGGGAVVAQTARLHYASATTCGQSVNGHINTGGLPTGACPEDGKPLFDKTCHVYSDDVKTCPIDGLPLYNGHIIQGGLTLSARATGLHRAGQMKDCGPLINGHVTSGGQLTQQCPEDGKPIFPSGAHVFVDDRTVCPYDSALL